MQQIAELNTGWQQLWQFGSRSVLHRQEIDRLFQLLVAAYTHPDRCYHNLDHIHHLLTILAACACRSKDTPIENQIQSPTSVFLAAWFHDLVYDPHASDNEYQSAKLAGELLQNIVESTELIDRVQQLIIATKEHQPDPNDFDLCIFLDADLAILGTDSARYQSYARSIRREYNWVSDELYRLGRIEVLETFLQRDRIYQTEQLFDQLEPAARLNIQQEILSLLNANSPV